jgi:diguanylate cyclase (GGDEF)-like protein
VTQLDRDLQGNTPSDPQREILLLADDDLGKQLVPRFEQGNLLTVENPYDAIRTLADRPCRAVVLTGPRKDFAGLARAFRRLGPETKVLAFCPAEAEEELHAMAEEFLDACHPYPPTAAELASILQDLLGTDPLLETPKQLTLGQIAELIPTARNQLALERALQTLIAARLETTLDWLIPQELAPGVEPLLYLPVHPPRVLAPRKPVSLNDEIEQLLGELHHLLGPLVGLSRRMESLHHLAITDHLTGVYNRRYFYILTNRILARAKDNGFRATLLLYDIDDFKAYNDEFGHAAGDDILRDTARMMHQLCRDHDVVARIGGDEFAVLFWDEEPREAGSEPLRNIQSIASRFCRAVADHDFTALGPKARGRLTISGGIASCPDHGQTCVDLLRQADDALRGAKGSGKNTILLVGQESD